MNQTIQTVQLGGGQVSAITVSAGQGKFSETLNAPRSEWYPRYATLFEQNLALPTQCVLVQLPETTLLVDAGIHNSDPDWHFAIPHYVPPPKLVQQMAAIGVRPEAIDLVIITHTHEDHYNGLSMIGPEGYEPCFPNARHYLGRADWGRVEIQTALQDPQSVESQTLGLVHQQGLLTLVDRSQEINEYIDIIPAPGETIGHQIVRVHSEGETLYCLGDLYHHPIEVEHPTWTTVWSEDINGGLASREALTEAALAEEALLIATHIGGLGRLKQSDNGVVWDAVI